MKKITQFEIINARVAGTDVSDREMTVACPMNDSQTVISDIDGKAGRDIITAIIDGERDAEVLADLRNRGIKASRGEIVKYPEGTWTEEHLFEPEQCFRLYEYHKTVMEDCEKKTAAHPVKHIEARHGGVMPSPGKKNAKSIPKAIRLWGITVEEYVHGREDQKR